MQLRKIHQNLLALATELPSFNRLNEMFRDAVSRMHVQTVDLRDSELGLALCIRVLSHLSMGKLRLISLSKVVKNNADELLQRVRDTV